MDSAAGLIDGYWLPVRDGDRRVYALLQRHYSYRAYSDGRPHTLFAGVGEKMVLLTEDCQAAFIWRYSQVPGGQAGWQDGVACSFFRNEGPILSSVLIREACELAWLRWPGERLFTFVADAKIRSINPGACFKKAGWKTCGRNATGKLTILERLPGVQFMKHTCAVCWTQQTTHDEWHDHAVDEHGAELDAFGFKTCLLDHKNTTRCSGALNTAKLGRGIVRRNPAKKPEPFEAKDGTVYTPTELPI